MKDTLKLLPLLVLYLAVVLAFASDTFWGDESRYVGFAGNLAQGYYSPREGINLWNGPGYPLLLAPFVALGVPLLAAKVLNALLLYGAVLLFLRALRAYLPEKPAFAASVVFGLYPPFWRELHLLLTETFTYFLVCAFLCSFCWLHRGRRRRPGLLAAASLSLGWLALTKVVFGYVILGMLVLTALALLVRRTTWLARSLAVFGLALLCCMPYLGYTQALTGKWFYWSDAGGWQLYWMASPHEGELGSWFARSDVAADPRLKGRHQAVLDEVDRLPPVERDEALTRKALQNIARHPRAYLRNWLANVGRLLFSYPFSYTEQKLSTYFYLLPNMFLVVLCVLSAIPGWIGRRSVPPEMWALLALAGGAFLGSATVSAYDRQFRPLVPILLLWLAFVAARIVRFDIRKEEEAR